MQPKIEAEIAFVMERDVGNPSASLRAISSARSLIACQRLEIVDSAIADWKITLVDTVADNASSGGFALGTIATVHKGRSICVSVAC